MRNKFLFTLQIDGKSRIQRQCVLAQRTESLEVSMLKLLKSWPLWSWFISTGTCPVTHDMSLIGLTGAVACTAGDGARLMLLQRPQQIKFFCHHASSSYLIVLNGPMFLDMIHSPQSWCCRFSAPPSSNSIKGDKSSVTELQKIGCSLYSIHPLSPPLFPP